MSIPIVEIDFDSTEGIWSAVPASYWKSATSLISSFNREGVKMAGKPLWFALRKGGGLAHTLLGGHYGDEIKELAEGAGVPTSDIITANLAYDLSHVGCSTFAVPTSSGPLLARNLDWTFPRGQLKKHLTIVRVRNAPRGDYATVTWPGLFGVLTAVAPGRFSVAVNHVINESESTTGKVAKRALQGNWPVSWVVRKALDEAKDFTAACRILKNYPLVAPVIFTVTGISNDQRVVIERGAEDCALRKTGDKQAVFATNHYMTDAFDEENTDLDEMDTLERYEALTRRLAAAPPSNAKESFKVLSASDVIRYDTQHQVSMSACSGELVVRIPGQRATTVKL